MSQPASQQQKPLVERAGWAMFWNVAFFPLKLIIPFLAGIVLVRELRAEGWAVYGLSLALLDFLGLFSDFGIDRTLPRYLPEVELKYGRRGITRLMSGVTGIKGAVILLVVLSLALAPSYWITQFQLGENGELILLLISILLVLGALSDISIQFLYTHFRQRATNSLDVMVAIVRPSLTAGFVLIGWGVAGALFALLIATVLSVVISVVLAVRLIRRIDLEPNPRKQEVKLPSNRPLTQRMFSFAALNYLINWSVYLYDLDFVLPMMSLLITDNAVFIVQGAAIQLAYKFAKEFLRALVVPLTGVQTPLFSRLYAEGRMEGLRTAYATLTKVLILGLLPAGVGLIVTARNMLQILYGQVGGDAVMNASSASIIVACTAIITVGVFGESIIGVALNVLMVYEDYRAVIISRLFSLVSIPLLLWLVPQLGAIGAAIAVAVAGLSSRSVALSFGLRKLGLRFPGTFFVRVGTSSAIMGFALLPFLAYLPPNIPATIAMILTGLVVFLAAFKLLGGVDQADKDRLLSLRMPFVKQVLRFL
ncbi:MAG TPA: oligosaccharide flippase family protein [Chloroflexia bacterium]|nr:oligosaccharide flippase family protein [Chloroflexia bacterium]